MRRYDYDPQGADTREAPLASCSSALPHYRRHDQNHKASDTFEYQRSPNSTIHLGTLNVLPLELLHSIFEMLDLQTLSSITRTCLRGTAIFESLPVYRDLL